LIWLFPGKEVPITAENVLLSLRCAEEAATDGEPSVKYFSSVPYVLQMLLDNAKGLDVLSSMDIVGVGGAALPEAVGDDLVQKGVNLISRFGSAECGFLMSSHREYEADKAWQYLRSTSGAKALAFEKQENGLFELIVLPGWPHMAKQNREDGSFATADLFIPHPSIQNAWKYHSRSDSQLTLVTGKKFDQSPLESEIATSPLLQDVLVFGNGRQYPGALLFRSPAAERLSDSELVEELWPVIETVNKNGQAHTRLSKPMLVVVPGGTAGLKKSSKGTVLRQVAEQSYNDLIENAYLGFQQDDDLLQGISSISIADGDFPEFLTQIVQKELGHSENLHGDADLFSLGLDSVGCIRVRANLQKILPSGSSALPLNVVYDCGTINRLSTYLVELRNGRSSTVDDEILLMRQLVTEHSNYPNLVSKDSPIIDAKPPDDIKPTGEVVVLTGATGALGAHILDQLRSDPSVSQIYCLVRAADATAAFERVSKSLAFRKRRPLDPSDCKVLCVTAKLGKPKLGLTDDMYTLLAERTTLIIHAAWAVNFSMRLRSFIPDHIIGLRNLLDLSLQSPQTTPPRFLFCSSTASVLGDTAKSAIPESASRDPSDASPLGYSRSKWVAERICEQAHLQTRLSGRIAILRIGQLCGDTENGVWNVSEAWPLMLSTVHATGSMPALVHEHLGWLPVDVAACAVLQIAGEQTKAKSDDVPVYHLINYNTIPTWMEMLEWLKKFHGTFEIVVPSRWVEQLEGLSGLHKDHPAKKLLGLWKAAYCEKGGDSVPIEVHFDMDKTKAAAPILKDLAPIMEEHFGKMWKWIEDEMISKSGLPTT
jgi:thioester reductase-like protein